MGAEAAFHVMLAGLAFVNVGIGSVMFIVRTAEDFPAFVITMFSNPTPKELSCVVVHPAEFPRMRNRVEETIVGVLNESVPTLTDGAVPK
jgi:hypothetical protein